MKICFFIGAMSKGGAERQLIYIANGLVERGHDVRIVTLQQGDAYLDLLDKRTQYSCLDITNIFSALVSTIRYFKQTKPELVITMLFHSVILGRLVGYLLQVKCISSYRNTNTGSRIRDMLLKNTAFLDSVTTSNTKEALSKYQPNTSKHVVIPNIYHHLSRHDEKLKIPLKTSFRWCFAGRLEKQKNLGELIKAFSRFSKTVTQDSDLVLLGEGSLRVELEELSKTLGVSDKVLFLGHSYGISSILMQSDCFVLPSIYEGMPNVLIEAMSEKLPILATPVGAVPDMVIDGITGIISAGVAETQLFDAMLRVYSLEAEVRQSMINAAHAYVTENYNENVIIPEWEKIVHVALKGSIN